MTRRAAIRLGAIAIVAGTLVYLRDPLWLGGLTSGLGDWKQDEQGVAFRWAGGHASFFVSADATIVTIPLRAVLPADDRRAVAVRIALNDRPAAEAMLSDARWIEVQVPCAGVPVHGRRYVRIDLRASRAWSDDRPIVQVGAVTTAR